MEARPIPVERGAADGHVPRIVDHGHGRRDVAGFSFVLSFSPKLMAWVSFASRLYDYEARNKPSRLVDQISRTWPC